MECDEITMPEKDKSFQLYDTLVRKKRPFVPREKDAVSIYVCGVTPYDDAHIGHARPSVFFDVVRKYLTHKGWRVKLVQNFTDIDDKIIERAAEKGMQPIELAAHFSERYLAAMDRLGVARADEYPKVSEHIDDIIDMIAVLVEKGSAYTGEGNVFFAVDTFDDYGKLSGQRKEELIESGRVETVPGKASPLDFTLWKAAKPGEPAWDSPWGPGRPGWHIECSAMSLKYLGDGFDIHGGGLDLIFPHHENEIAQSEAFTGQQPFVNYWIHNGLINMGDEKMSKSLGNFVSVDELVDVYEKAFLRFLLLQHHYRSPIEFNDDYLESTGRGWRRLNDVYRRLKDVVTKAQDAGLLQDAPVFTVTGATVADDQPEASRTLFQLADAAWTKFDESLADDFNTSGAIAALFELVNKVRPQVAQAENALADGNGDGAYVIPGLAYVTSAMDTMGRDILGILTEQPMEKVDSDRGRTSGGDTEESNLVDGLVQIILAEREQARRDKQWDRADGLRDALAALGITLIDTPEGTKWVRGDGTDR